MKDIVGLDTKLLKGHGNVLKVLDTAFGAFFGFMSLLTGIGYLLGHVEAQTPLALFFFSFVNIVISRFSAKSSNPLPIELFRILVLGNALTFAGFLLIDEPFASFWPLYLVMSLGCGILVFLQTKKRTVAYFQTGIWLLNYGVAMHYRPEPLNWYKFLGTSAVIVCITGLITQLLYTLARSLERETTAKEQLIQSSKMSALGQMAGSIAHEINSPLATIQIVSQQLQDLAKEKEIDGARVSRMAEIALKTTTRIAAIIKGLRTFSRDGSRDEMVPVPIKQVVDDTLALCSEKLKNHGIAVSVHHQNAETNVLCQPSELSQVLLNLVSNASDAVAKQEQKWIRIETRPTEKMIEVTVTDSGNNIPLNIQKQVFEPFFTTKEIGKGTGLGLSVSKGIVEKHGGKIWLDSTHSNTRFVFSVPLSA